MALYRIKSHLSNPRFARAGTVQTLDELPDETKTILLALGHIEQAYPPPLSRIPDWDKRKADKFEDSVETFIRTDDNEVAKALRVKVDTVPQLKQTVLEYLQAPKQG